MKLSITLPASVDDLARFVDACRTLDIGPAALDDESPTAALVATDADEAPVVEPERPALAAKKAPANRKAPAAKAKSKRASGGPKGGTIAVAVLTTLADADGMFDGSLQELAEAANPSSVGATVQEIRKLDGLGAVAIDRISPRKVRRTAITTDGRKMLARMTDGPTPDPEPKAKPLAAVPDPKPTPAPLPPAAAKPLPPGGLKPPSGGFK